MAGTAPFVHGWRLSRKSAGRGKWLDNGDEHERFRGQLSALSSHYDALLKTDVVSCFSSMSVDRVRDALYESLGTGTTVAKLVDMLEAWQAVPSRSGLPQRCSASAALANFFLSPIDEVLQRHGKARGLIAPAFKDGTALRWMDDVWLFSNTPGRLRQAQVRLQDALRGLGLEMNHSKTQVLQSADAEEEAKSVRHSAVETGLDSDPQDLGALEALIEELVAGPEGASRTALSFVCRRLRDNDLTDHAGSFLDVAHRMPQGADMSRKPPALALPLTSSTANDCANCCSSSSSASQCGRLSTPKRSRGSNREWLRWTMIVSLVRRRLLGSNG